MYKEIIYGCMFLSFGVLALILAFRTSRPQRKLGRKFVCCGTVTHAVPETNTITVTYTLNGTEQTVTQNESLRTQSDAPPARGTWRHRDGRAGRSRLTGDDRLYTRTAVGAVLSEKRLSGHVPQSRSPAGSADRDL